MNKLQKARKALELFAKGKAISPAGLARAIRNAQHDPRGTFEAGRAASILRAYEEHGLGVKLESEQAQRARENGAETARGEGRNDHGNS